MLLPQGFVAPEWKRILEQADGANVKQNGIFECGAKGAVILRDSAGVRWRITVSTAGALSAVKA